MMMFELRIDIFYNYNIIWSLYCEPAPLFNLQAQATTPSIYLHTHIVWAFTEGFQTFLQGPIYIPVYRCGNKHRHKDTYKGIQSLDFLTEGPVCLSKFKKKRGGGHTGLEVDF